MPTWDGRHGQRDGDLEVVKRPGEPGAVDGVAEVRQVDHPDQDADDGDDLAPGGRRNEAGGGLVVAMTRRQAGGGTKQMQGWMWRVARGAGKQLSSLVLA
jgi:hypothetical protein